MRTATRLGVATAVLAAMIGASPVCAARMTDFDLNKLDNWADAIAVCDINRFLLTDPDVMADAIIVPGKGNTHTVLYAPLYVPPTNFFSDAMHQTFDNVHRAGLVTPEAYGGARLHYATAMISAYRSATLADKRYMLDQMDLCYHLAARAGVKLDLSPARLDVNK